MNGADVYSAYNEDKMKKQTKPKQSTVRVESPTPDQAAVLKVLSPKEKLQAMLEAAKKKAQKSQ